MEIDYGWDTPPQAIKDAYRAKCLELANDDNLFKDFRRDPHYADVLEGFEPDVGNGALQEISRMGKENDFVERFSSFAKNDTVGNPQLLELPDIGKMAPNTARYVGIAYEIAEYVENPKVIVEIGAGYGGMARMLTEFFDFDRYIIVDLPEALALTKKYLYHFPDFDKYVFLAPDQIEKIGAIDLFIADASLSECNADTQEKYINTYGVYAKHLFILYNTLHLEETRATFISIITSLTRYSFRFRRVLNHDGFVYDSLVKLKATRI